MTEIIAEFGSSIVPHLCRYPTNSTFGEFTAWSGKAKTVRPGFDSYRECILDWWCKTAAKSGATHVKIQCFKAEHFPIAERDSKRPLEFPRELVPLFVETAHHYGLKAGASVFDKEAVELAAQHCDFIKLAAREQRNTDLWRTVWNGYGVRYDPDTQIRSFGYVYRSLEEISLYEFYPFSGATLATVQEYPTVMLKAVIFVCRAAIFFSNKYRKGKFWGWSSHTRGWLDCWLAAKLGASVIEKHIAMSPSDIEAGHSLLPGEFAKMTRAING